MINQYDGIGPGIAIKYPNGDTYEPKAGMPKDQLLTYSRKLVELCESVQGVRGDILTPIKNAAAEVSDAIKTANARALGPAFSELMMRSVVCMLVDSYRGVKAEKAAQGSRTGEMIRQLGKDYHTAVSGCDEKSRASFVDYIGETASGLGLDKTIVAKILRQAESIYEKHGDGEKRSRRSDSVRRLKDEVMGKKTQEQHGAAYAGGEEQEVVFTADLKLESIAEQPDESGLDMHEPDLERVRKLTGMRGIVGAKCAVPSAAPEVLGEKGALDEVVDLPEPPKEEYKEPPKPPEEEPSLVQRLEGQPLAVKPTEPPGKVYTGLPRAEPPRKDTGRQRAKTSIIRTLPKGEPYSGRPSAVLRRPAGRYKPGFTRRAVRVGAKIAGAAILAAGIVYVAALLTHIYSPKSRKYLGPEKLGVVGRIIEGPSKWARGEN